MSNQDREDVAVRYRQRREESAAKAAQLLELQRRADHNGYVREKPIDVRTLGTAEQGAAPSAEPAAPAQGTPVHHLRPGAMPAPPEPQTTAEKIAVLEAQGARATARALKTQLLYERAEEMWR